jgi:hypothetical protein
MLVFYAGNWKPKLLSRGDKKLWKLTSITSMFSSEVYKILGYNIVQFGANKLD